MDDEGLLGLLPGSCCFPWRCVTEAAGAAHDRCRPIRERTCHQGDASLSCRAAASVSFTSVALTGCAGGACWSVLTAGFGDRWEARIARVALEAEQTGVTHFRLRPGKRSPFAHRHVRAEEVYVILAGTGRVKLDDDIADVRMLDAIRIAPEVVRAFEAGPDGVAFLLFGPHHEADGEQVDDVWV